MAADLFISYAWTSQKHREWVRLLAVQLKALGFDVLLDAHVNYGDDLNGFMRRIGDANRVLLVVDRNYIERANNKPESGVAKENLWIEEHYEGRDDSWLSALFIDNVGCELPAWLGDRMLKSFNFNFSANSAQQFPGAEQIEDLWRWIAHLPANRDNATPIAILRERATRLELHSLRSEPSQWRSPHLEGEEHFHYGDAPGGTFVWGFGESEFSLKVSGCGDDSVHVYNDGIRAVGLVPNDRPDNSDFARHLSPGRTVTPRVGQSVVLMNDHGRLAIVDILDVQREENGSDKYIAPFVRFCWRVIEAS